MKIYFAGSIRGGRDDKDLYLQIINLLSNYGQVLTEHIGDAALSSFGEDGMTDEYIHDRDLAWLEEANVVVAEVTNPSLGVGYEIAKASGKKPVLCLFRAETGKRISAMINGNRDAQVKEYNNLSEIRGILSEFFKS